MTFPLTRRLFIGASLGAGLAAAMPLQAALPDGRRTLAGPGGREVHYWLHQPRGRPLGTILFSHGALSAPWKYEALIARWSAAGYRVIAPLHVDSTDHPQRDRFPGFASWKARIEDLRALAATIPGRRYIAAGHSYGGLCALALGGANPVLPEGIAGPLRDPRAGLVLAFSPPGAMPGLVDRAGYAGLAVPALIQTGTHDIPPGETDWQGHLLAWEAAAPGGSRYALVLEGVDHYFGGAICRPELPGPKQSAELELAAATSLRMLGAYHLRRRADRKTLAARLGGQDTARLMLR